MPAWVRRSAKGAPALAPGSVRSVATRMLAHLGLRDAELSVLLTDDRSIHALNREWRKQDKPTDVLAFPIDERAARAAYDEESGGADVILGDVVISLHTAERQARSRKRELFEEVRFLLAHGLLHLLGFDHATAAEKREMSALTRRLVRAAAREERRPSRAAATKTRVARARNPRGR